MDVNVVGLFRCARAAAPALKDHKGCIVNITSVAGQTGMGSSIAYAASKAALNNLTLALARSLAPKIRVNGLCPGFVDTQWTKGRMDESTYARFKSHIQNMTPLHRMATADEVAASALFLVANNTPITGQLLVIDGGNHLTVNAPDFDP